jgi:hypothetical protein
VPAPSRQVGPGSLLALRARVSSAKATTTHILTGIPTLTSRSLTHERHTDKEREQ